MKIYLIWSFFWCFLAFFLAVGVPKFIPAKTEIFLAEESSLADTSSQEEKLQALWTKIETNYLPDLQVFKVSNVKGVSITNLEKIKAKTTPFETLPEPVKEELANLIVVSDWEPTLQKLLAKSKEKWLWTIIQNKWLDKIQKFDVVQIWEVEIPYLEATGDKTVAYEDLSLEIRKELNALLVIPFSALPKMFSDFVDGAQLQSVWTKIWTYYLPDLQRFKIKMAEGVDISQLVEFEKQTPAYGSLPPAIKTELKNLVALANWEAVLQKLIAEKEGGKSRIVWTKIRINYLPALQKFNISTIGGVEINELEAKAEQTTPYDDLSEAIKGELNLLGAVSNWEETLQELITKPKAEKIWTTIQTKYLLDLQTLKIKTVGGVDLTSLVTIGNQTTSYGNLLANVQQELANLATLSNWELTLQNLIRTEKSKKIWKTIQTDYLTKIWEFGVETVGMIAINHLRAIEDKTIPYQDLSLESQTELANLVPLSNWELALKESIAQKLWILIDENYLSDLRFYSIATIKKNSIANLIKIKEKTLSYQTLPEAVKKELKDLLAISNLEKVVTDLIKIYKAKLLWLVIQDGWLDEIQKFDVQKIGKIKIPYLLATGDKTTGYDELSLEIRKELNDLTIFTIFQDAVDASVQAAKLQQIWTKIRTYYLSDLQRFEIKIVAGVDLSQLIALEEEIPAYENLPLEIQTKLKDLVAPLNVAPPNWELSLQKLIEKETEGESRIVWTKIRTNYLPDLQKFDITTIGEVEINELEAKAKQTTSYDDLLGTIKEELNELALSDWEPTLQALLTKAKAQKAWTTIQTSYLPDLQTLKIKTAGGVDITNLVAIDDPTLSYQNLSPDIHQELANLVALSNWELTLQNLIRTEKSKKIWTTVQTKYLDHIWEFEIEAVDKIEIPHLRAVQDKTTLYQDLGLESQTELANLATLSNWETVLIKAIAEKLWSLIAKNYLSNLQLLKVQTVNEIEITNLLKVKDKATAFEDLPEEVKTELKELIVLSNFEMVFTDLIETHKLKVTWGAIQDETGGWFDDIQKFDIRKVADVDITNLREMADKTTAFEDLSDKVKKELENLNKIPAPYWSGVLLNLINIEKAKLIWITIQTDYLADLQKFEIQKVAGVDIINLVKVKDKTTVYQGLLPAVQTELGYLVGVSNLEKVLTDLIEVAKAQKIWTIIQTNYFAALQRFEIPAIEGVDITNLRAVEDQTTPYQDLTPDAQMELKELIKYPSWEKNLQVLLAAETRKVATAAWETIKTNYFGKMKELNVKGITAGGEELKETSQTKGTEAFESLDVKVQKELEKLIESASWETNLSSFLTNQAATKIWETIKTDYFAELKKWKLKGISPDGTELAETLKEDQATNYPDLDVKAQAELKGLLENPSWETDLQALIAAQKTKVATAAWETIKINYFSKMKELNVKGIRAGGEELKETFNTAGTELFGSLDVKVQKELEKLIENLFWETDLSSFLTNQAATKIWETIKTDYFAELKKWKLKGISPDGSELVEILKQEQTANYPDLDVKAQAELKGLLENPSWETDLQALIAAQKTKTATVAWTTIKTNYFLDLKAYQVTIFNIAETTFSLTNLLLLDSDDLPEYSALSPEQREELKKLVDQTWEAPLKEAIAAKIWIKFQTNYFDDLKIYQVTGLTPAGSELINISQSSKKLNYHQLTPETKAELQNLIANLQWESDLDGLIKIKKIKTELIWDLFKKDFLAVLKVYQVKSLLINGKVFSISGLKAVYDSATPYQNLTSAFQTELGALVGKSWLETLKTAIAQEIWNDIRKNYRSDLSFYEVDSLKLKKGVEFSLTEIASEYEELSYPVKLKLLSYFDFDWKMALEEIIIEKIWDEFKWYLSDLKTYQITLLEVAKQWIDLQPLLQNAALEYQNLGSEVKEKLKGLINKDWISSLETIIASMIWNQVKPFLLDLKKYEIANFIADGEFFSLLSLKAVVNPADSSYAELDDLAQVTLKSFINIAWKAGLQTAISQAIWKQFKTYLLALKLYQIEEILLDDDLFDLIALKNAASLPGSDYFSLETPLQTKLKELVGKAWEPVLQTAIATVIWTKLKTNYLVALQDYEIAGFSIADQFFSFAALKTVPQPETTSYQNLENGPQAELKALINQAWESALEMIIAAQLSKEKIWNKIKVNYFVTLKSYQVTSLKFGTTSFSLTNLLTLNADNLPSFENLGEKMKTELANLVGKTWESAIKFTLAEKIWTKLKTSYLLDLQFYSLTSLEIDQIGVELLALNYAPFEASYQDLNQLVKVELVNLIGLNWEEMLTKVIASKIWDEIRTNYLFALQKYDIKFYDESYLAPTLSYQELPKGLQTELCNHFVGKGTVWRTLFKQKIAPKIWNDLKANYLLALKTYQISSLLVETEKLSLVNLGSEASATSYQDLSVASHKELEQLIPFDWEPLLLEAISLKLSVEAIWGKLQTTYLPDLKTYQITQLAVADQTVNLIALLNLTQVPFAYDDLIPTIQAELVKLVGENWETALQTILAEQFWLKIKTENYLEELTLLELNQPAITINFQKIAQLAPLTTPYQDLNWLVKMTLKQMIGTDWEASIEVAQTFLAGIYQPLWTKLSSYLPKMKTYAITSLTNNNQKFLLEKVTGLQTTISQYQALDLATRQELFPLIQFDWEKILQLSLTWKKLRPYLVQLAAKKITKIEQLEIETLTKQEATPDYENLSSASKAVLEKLSQDQNWEEKIKNLINPPSSSVSTTKSSTVTIILASVGGVIFLLLVLFLGYKYFWRKKLPKAV